MDQFSWIMPLLLLPGVGLLVQSTSVRFGGIHDEFHRMLEMGMHHHSPIFIKHLATRAQWFRNALVALYISVCAFALGSILGAIADLLWGKPEIITVSFASVGIISLLFAAVQLVRESFLSLEVLQVHLDEIERGTAST